MYSHLTITKRIEIGVLKKAGFSPAAIARELGIHRSTVSRELRRNSTPTGRYRPHTAQRKAEKRRGEAKEAYRVIDSDPALQEKIEKLLHPLRSPETVGHMVHLHHQRIYTWIYQSKPDLISKLPHQGRRRRYGVKTKRNTWSKKTKSIHTRPHTKGLSWEGDTVIGRTKTRVLTHVERHSLFLDARIIPDGTSDCVHHTLRQQPLTGQITYDCGSEFALWRMIEQDTGATVYFTDPHSPGQRGKNENTNGRLRRVFPKHTDFSQVTPKQLAATVRMMNRTPRKSLNWRTPEEVYTEIVALQPRI